MKLNIHGSAHDSVSVVTRHCKSIRKIDRKDTENQIGVVQNFFWFCSIMESFRINLLVTNNVSMYEK